MPLSTKTIATLKRPCTFDYCGETVNLMYYPAAIGKDMISQAQTLLAQANAATDEVSAQEAILAIGSWLCGIFAAWDFLQDDGETPQPITPENMGALNEKYPDFMSACLLAIMRTSQQGNANGTPS